MEREVFSVSGTWHSHESDKNLVTRVISVVYGPVVLEQMEASRLQSMVCEIMNM